MKRVLWAILLMVLVPFATNAATITFSKVTTYTDSTPIPAAKIPTIVYRAWYGPTQAGPWTQGVSVTDNLAITAPDPAPGTTVWYAVDASLDGKTSAKCVPASKAVAPSTPNPPPGCTVR